MMLAQVTATTGTRHYTLDHLGSPRLVTGGPTGLAVGTQFLSRPSAKCGTTDGGALQFTAHERDAALFGNGLTALPDYHARALRHGVGTVLVDGSGIGYANGNAASSSLESLLLCRQLAVSLCRSRRPRSKDIIVVPITIVLATQNKQLQHKAQRSLAQAQSFFAHADIHFSVTRVHANPWWEGSTVSGTVATAAGPAGVEDFLNNTRGLVVFVGAGGNFYGL